LLVQVNGVKTCLDALGPWGAAAAAHLDLLSSVPDEDDAGAEEPEEHIPEEGQDDDVDEGEGGTGLKLG
jgi:hypothetical protein